MQIKNKNIYKSKAYNTVHLISIHIYTQVIMCINYIYIFCPYLIYTTFLLLIWRARLLLVWLDGSTPKIYKIVIIIKLLVSGLCIA